MSPVANERGGCKANFAASVRANMPSSGASAEDRLATNRFTALCGIAPGRQRADDCLTLSWLCGINRFTIPRAESVDAQSHTARSQDRRVAPARHAQPSPRRASAIRSSPTPTSSTPAIWSRSSTRWCAGCASTGRRSSHSAAAFGFSRPSFYQAQAALAGGGLAALVPRKPGPRRAHKLTRR